MRLEAFFRPNSVAVVGASREPEKVGYRVFKNLLDSGFQGKLYPINPSADELLGHICYKNILEVPGEVDLAIIVVPARITPSVAQECGEKGVKGLVVISAGFSETGREGTNLEKNLLAICRKYGMRMQGPNCLGIISTQTSLNASFAGAKPTSGSISFISQSGALGSTILNWALQNKIGFTSFISLGNEADLNAADFLEALAEDEETKCVGLYIEGVKQGQRFIELAQKVTALKPIIALKAGTTDVGIRAVSSHTGSLAGSDNAFSAAFKKAGIIRVDTLEDLFNLVLAFEDAPIPKGRKIMIVTNGGGPGILVADACEKLNLELPSLEYESREVLRNLMPPHASLNNPIDVLGDADDNRYSLALKAALNSKMVDGIIVIVTPQAMTPADRIAESICEVGSNHTKPIITVFMGYDDDSTPIGILREHKIPNYMFPDAAATALKNMCDYAEIRESSSSNEIIIKFEDERIGSVLDGLKGEDRLSLTVGESLEIAESCGISVPQAMLSGNKAEAAEIAKTIGYPVVMKIVSPDILHKTDFGGVLLNVRSSEELENNYEVMVRKAQAAMPEARITGVLIQKMVSSGKEVIVGAVRDLQFGPLIMFGLGGIYVNFLRDVSYRLCPLTESEATDMIRETKAYTLLRGVRGESPSDIISVIDVMMRISEVMMRFPKIVEIEINPLFVYEENKGCTAVDVRTTIGRSNETAS